MYKRILLYITLFTTIIFTLSNSNPITPLVSASNTVPDLHDRVIYCAEKFLDTLGIRQDAATAEVVQPKSGLDSDDRWEVKWPTVIVRVDSEADAVRDFDRSDMPQHTDDTVVVTKDQAEAAIRACIIACNLNADDYLCIDAEAMNHTQQPGQIQWEVTYSRVYEGYQYKSLGCVGYVDTLKPVVQSFGFSYGNPIPPIPKSLELTISKEKAATLATKNWSDRGRQIGQVIDEDLKIILVSRQGETVHESDTPTEARLAWIIKLSAPKGKEPNAYVISYVDVSDGTILGEAETQ